MKLSDIATKTDPDAREVLLEGVADVGAVVIATFVIRRNLRKLGYGKKEVYALNVLFTSLFWTRLHLNGIRRELRRQRIKKS